MHDVTWRTGCTLTILVLLVLLGSGKLLDGPEPAPTPLPAGESARGASYEAGPSTPEAGTLPAAHEDAAPPETTAGAHRSVAHVLPVPR